MAKFAANKAIGVTRCSQTVVVRWPTSSHLVERVSPM